MTTTTINFNNIVNATTQPEAIIKILDKPYFNECFVYIEEPLKKYFFILLGILFFLFLCNLIPNEKFKNKGLIMGYTIYALIMISIFIMAMVFIK